MTYDAPPIEPVEVVTAIPPQGTRGRPSPWPERIKLVQEAGPGKILVWEYKTKTALDSAAEAAHKYTATLDVGPKAFHIEKRTTARQFKLYVQYVGPPD